ncbi:MAG: hypothetical protein U0L42_00875 [Methanobrevibacter sp.]|jgi:hypothetical protein|uniref:hypothetical protein n=1 Tax=Methanobrevibacter sp. TaxID=66852 RepID=UPI002E7967AA|nr:hypothetical protein [Methanobrevibacter sp.]MEE0934204.1 hypothetical protein [Methanobrevibacter sp.]
MSSIKINEEELRSIQQRFSALYDLVVNTEYLSENMFSITKSTSAKKGMEIMICAQSAFSLFSEIVKKTDSYLGMTIEGFQSVDEKKANEFKTD